MKNLTLTPRDIEKFAESGRHALHLFVGQYALIAPKFPTVTDEAVAAMIASVKADPHGTPKKPGIDVAVYFAAMYRIGAANLESAIKALAEDADVATLQMILQQTTACGNSINAMTLVSRDGLMSQLHEDEAKQKARSNVGKKAAETRHSPNNAARDWVISEWMRDAHHYQGKADFSRIYAPRVARETDVKGNAQTIAEKWLNQK